MIDLDLSGKRAVVTGASLGIGEATVKMLAEHGADVSFCARTAESVEKLSSLKTIMVQLKVMWQIWERENQHKVL